MSKKKPAKPEPKAPIWERGMPDLASARVTGDDFDEVLASITYAIENDDLTVTELRRALLTARENIEALAKSVQELDVKIDDLEAFAEEACDAAYEGTEEKKDADAIREALEGHRDTPFLAWENAALAARCGQYDYVRRALGLSS